MRSTRNFVGDFKSSFLSCEKDTEIIISKLFQESKPYSDELKRLLLINTRDCLDDRINPAYKNKIETTSIADMVKGQYLRFCPQLKFGENEQVKSYLTITYDMFTSNATNIHYRDHVIEIDILCHFDCWDLGNFRQRPVKIAGYIDGILNNAKLTGIGHLEFSSCNMIVASENYSGYCLTYRVVTGDDDTIEPEDLGL